VAELRASTADPERSRPEGLLGLLRDLHATNVAQWTCEDRVRSSDRDDSAIADAKREIDVLNARRHQFVEAVDAAIDAALPQVSSATPSTESPGMAFDRLSVLVIRIQHTAEAAAEGQQAPELQARLPVLHRQLSVLEEALDALLVEICEGSRRFLPHQSMKLYAP
jgi:hypothetical protein